MTQLLIPDLDDALFHLPKRAGKYRDGGAGLMWAKMICVIIIIGTISTSFGAMAQNIGTTKNFWNLIKTIKLDKYIPESGKDLHFCGDGYILIDKGKYLSILKLTDDGSIIFLDNIKSTPNANTEKAVYPNVIDCVNSSNEGAYAYVKINGNTGLLKYHFGRITFYPAKIFWPNPNSGDLPILVCGDLACNANVDNLNLHGYNIIKDKKIYEILNKYILEDSVFLDDYILAWSRKYSTSTGTFIKNIDSYRCILFSSINAISNNLIKPCPKIADEIISLKDGQFYYFATTKNGLFHSEISSGIAYNCRYRESCKKILLNSEHNLFIHRSYHGFEEEFYDVAYSDERGRMIFEFCKEKEFINNRCSLNLPGGWISYRFTYRGVEYAVTGDYEEEDGIDIYKYSIFRLNN